MRKNVHLPCPEGGYLQLEGHHTYGDLLELCCLHESGQHDVQIYGRPEVDRRGEFDGFYLDRVAFVTKEHGIPESVYLRAELDRPSLINWQAEAYAIIADYDRLRESIEEKLSSFDFAA